MNQHQLIIEARHRPETLERVLRVIRHRGFRICAITMSRTASPDKINVEITVTGQRSVDMLSTQLNKLMDIAGIRIQSQSIQQISA